MKCVNKVLIVFLLSFLCSLSAADLYQEDQYWHDAFYSTDCSVPEDTQILHYPMMHQSSGEMRRLFEIVDKDPIETVSLSQWRLLQLYRRYPEALVFGEQFWSEADSHYANENSHRIIDLFLNKYRTGPDGMTPLLQNLKKRRLNVLNRIRNAESFEDLDTASKRVLYRGGGPIAALGLGLIDQVYPSTLFYYESEVFSLYWESVNQDPAQVSRRIRELVQESINTAGRWNKAESEEEKSQIEESFRTLVQEQEYLSGLQRSLLFPWREYLLRESVVQVLNQDVNKDKMVIISYGAGHDFSDEFKGYNFYRLPFSCSFLEQDASILNFIFGWNVFINASFMKTMNPSQEDIFRSFINSNVQNISDSSVEPMFQLMLDLDLVPASAEIGSAAQFKESLAAQVKSFTAEPEERWEAVFQKYISMSDEERSQMIEFLQNPGQKIEKISP